MEIFKTIKIVSNPYVFIFTVNTVKIEKNIELINQKFPIEKFLEKIYGDYQKEPIENKEQLEKDADTFAKKYSKQGIKHLDSILENNIQNESNIFYRCLSAIMSNRLDEKVVYDKFVENRAIFQQFIFLYNMPINHCFYC